MKRVDSATEARRRRAADDLLCADLVAVLWRLRAHVCGDSPIDTGGAS